MLRLWVFRSVLICALLVLQFNAVAWGGCTRRPCWHTPTNGLWRWRLRHLRGAEVAKGCLGAQHGCTGCWWTALLWQPLFQDPQLVLCCVPALPQVQRQLGTPEPLVRLAEVSGGSMQAWESGSLLLGQPRSWGMKILFLSPSRAHNAQFTIGACRWFSKGWWVPRSWSISSRASAWGTDQEKCYKQNMRSSLFTKEPERQQEGWHRAGAWRLLSHLLGTCRASLLRSASQSHAGRTLSRHWQSSCSKSSTGPLLRAQVHQVLGLWWWQKPPIRSTDKLLEFWKLLNG